MIYRYHLRLVLLVCLATGGAGTAQAAEPAPQNTGPAPRVFLLDGTALAKVRAAVLLGDERFLPAVQQLRSEADAAMTQGPFSVVSKPQTPPSGDKHDYMSQRPYRWPNPDTADGLPYVNRDGQVNPESREFDNAAKSRMEAAVTTLARAYYFTAHEPYAERAALLLRTRVLGRVDPRESPPVVRPADSRPDRRAGHRHNRDAHSAGTARCGRAAGRVGSLDRARPGSVERLVPPVSSVTGGEFTRQERGPCEQ